MENKKLNETLKKIRKMSSFWLMKNYKELPKEFSEKYMELKSLYSDISSLVFAMKAKDLAVIEHCEVEIFNDYHGTKIGDLVKIKPCGEWAEKKTYLGFFIGDVPQATGMKIEDNKIKSYLSFRNPAIFIPEVKKIVYGCESWWSKIESEDELKEITNVDIDNIWYVKALKEIK